MSTQSTGGAPELLGLAGVAVLAMALLAVGYNARKDPAPTATVQTPVSGSQSVGSAQNSGTSMDDRRSGYQPATPGPDKRDAPTSSTTGQSSNPGNTGQGGNAP